MRPAMSVRRAVIVGEPLVRRKTARLARRTAVDNPLFVGAASRSGAEGS